MELSWIFVSFQRQNLKTTVVLLILVTWHMAVAAQVNKFVVAEIKDGDTFYAERPIVKDEPGMHYRYVEHMPEPGVDIDSFISQNMRYPADAKVKKKQGRVVVMFQIDKEGKAVNVAVSKSVYPSLDKEAVRLIQAMPKWEPGSENGKNINVELSWPVIFKL